jgi:hypothetical protein
MRTQENRREMPQGTALLSIGDALSDGAVRQQAMEWRSSASRHALERPHGERIHDARRYRVCSRDAWAADAIKLLGFVATGPSGRVIA